MVLDRNTAQLVTKAQLDARFSDYTESLIRGEVQIPQPIASSSVFAGGTNHFPNSDISYSLAAATVQGTLPATAGDDNQEAWRLFRQKQADNLTIDAAHSLKAVGESTYAANEGAHPEMPDWDRVNGWIRMGSAAGLDQYDVTSQLLSRFVGPGDTWYFNFRCAALTADVVPAAVQFFVEVWEKRAAAEGVATGGTFDLTSSIVGIPGVTDTKYKVLAKTDSGVSVLSSLLDVATAPDALSGSAYIKIGFTVLHREGFVEFQIFRLRNGVYRKLFTVRNTVDFQYNDTGEDVGEVVGGWPLEPATKPRMYAVTKNLLIGGFGQGWQFNAMTLKAPSTYDFSQAVTQYLRFGLTAPCAVSRQIGIDRLFFSTTSNEWAPDRLPAFADGSYPIPSVAPTSGQQGSGGGIGPPPHPGTGGCVWTSTPVFLSLPKGRIVGRSYDLTFAGLHIKGERSGSYVIRQLSGVGTVSEHYVIRSRNGVTVKCSAGNRFLENVKERRFIVAHQIKAGVTRLPTWVKGRGTVRSLIVSVTFVPEPIEVGTYVLIDPTGELPGGQGIYVAGESKDNDRGFYHSNSKIFGE